MRHRPRTALVSCAAALVAVLPALPAEGATPGAGSGPSPGAPGAGDAYYPDYGNGGYDVGHYGLRLKYRPDNDRLEGTATLSVTATQALSRFNLDFALDVAEVRVDGRPARFARSGAHELEVSPARPLARGQRATIVVRYAGTPSEVRVDGRTNWQRTADGGIAANAPESAWWWFPSNDHPGDKATFDVDVTVPDGTQAISNGTLESRSSRGGWTRYAWRSDKPQATYLATLAMGGYDIAQDTTSSGLPVLTAYGTGLGADEGAARASVERTAEVTEWLERRFGPYPFNAVGGYVPNVDAAYALETQTRPVYAKGAFARGANVSVVVHELAHQWYGDSVTVRKWKDVWLSEGFARYAEWLWSEEQGEGTARELADYAYSLYPADDPFWSVRPGDPGPENQFHPAVYARGAMALQALRDAIGDRAFFAVLKGWPARHAYGNASVEDFTAYAEKISGRELGSLFDTWLYRQGKPPSARAGAAPERPASWKEIQATDRLHRGR
ncbi:M1 family metallopeptidase [Streptomyces sp. ODS28]|uniref:M1 family metallopeptidase n=1 Tax=Streptomyces sp. ODS28 TaxID=3136688 RepID=UPI0031EBE219